VSELAALTTKERRFLARRICGWCYQRLDRDSCSAIYRNCICTPEYRASRRETLLKVVYKPLYPSPESHK
jgi:hypothetical protein